MGEFLDELLYVPRNTIFIGRRGEAMGGKLAHLTL